MKKDEYVKCPKCESIAVMRVYYETTNTESCDCAECGYEWKIEWDE